MNTAYLIPLLWLRLIVIIAFGVFVTVQAHWWLVAIAVFFAGLTVWQIVGAYSQRRS